MTYIYVKYFFTRYITAVTRKVLKAFLGDVIVDWNVIVGSFDEELKLVKAKTIRNRTDSYFADPFLVAIDQKIFIFVEEYFWTSAIGKISLIEFNDFNLKYYGTILEEDFHLSFPFIFKQNENLYMIPETHQNANISLYEATKFPYQWTCRGHIIPDLCASDTVIFENKDHYFALCNNETGRFGDRLTNLALYTSGKGQCEELPHFDYVATIYNEATKSRNGGLFKWKNSYCRVNQIPSYNLYGKQISVNKICVKTNNGQIEYQETEIKDFQHLIETATKKFIGCHHLHVLEEERLFVCDVSSLKFKRKGLFKLDELMPKISLMIKRFIVNIN